MGMTTETNDKIILHSSGVTQRASAPEAFRGYAIPASALSQNITSIFLPEQHGVGEHMFN